MEDINTYYGIVLVIIVLGLIAYTIYVVQRKKHAKKKLTRFLLLLSRGYLRAKRIQQELQYIQTPTNEAIARGIKESLQTYLEKDFHSLYTSIYRFPKHCFRYPSKDTMANTFVGKIYPTIGILYQHYRHNKSLLDDLTTQFFDTSEEILLQELQNASKIESKKT